VKVEELQSIVEKAKNSNGDINDAIFVLAAMFESTSRHLKEVKAQQSEILSTLEKLCSRMDKIEEHTTDWVYRAIVED
jgi:predicted transcriptional regulator